MRPAIFLDRDGTLNVEKHYLYKRDDWEWTDGAIEALKRFQDAGFALVVITNQSGIARGYFSAQDVEMLHQWVTAQLAPHGIIIDGFYYCPHEPDITGVCDCRKPLPGMLLRAAKELNLDLKNSWMIGDKASDIQAGMAAGTKTLMVRTGYGMQEAPKMPNQLIVTNLSAAADYILH